MTLSSSRGKQTPSFIKSLLTLESEQCCSASRSHLLVLDKRIDISLGQSVLTWICAFTTLPQDSRRLDASPCVTYKCMKWHVVSLNPSFFFFPSSTVWQQYWIPWAFVYLYMQMGKLCSEGNAHICIHLDSWAPRTFRRGCSSLVKHLAQCGPTALIFLGVLLVLLKLGNFRGTLQPNICVVWPYNFYHLYRIQNCYLLMKKTQWRSNPTKYVRE